MITVLKQYKLKHYNRVIVNHRYLTSTNNNYLHSAKKSVSGEKLNNNTQSQEWT